MSKTIDDILTHEEMWAEADHPKFKQALYELFKAAAETIELTHKDDTRIWRQAKKYVALDIIAKLLGITNADQ